MDKKVVLITGGAKGLGKSLAKKFASLKYNVVITYLNSYNEAVTLKNELESDCLVDVLILKCDISKDDDVRIALEEIKNKYGHIDILINNAAISMDNYYLDKTKDEFMRVLEVNLYGTFLVTRESLKLMNNGLVLNISSLDSLTTYSPYNMDYSASKAGINNLTMNFNDNVTNNSFKVFILPWIATESVLEMEPIYLQKELARTNQKKLLDVDYVADFIVSNMDSKDVIICLKGDNNE